MHSNVNLWHFFPPHTQEKRNRKRDERADYESSRNIVSSGCSLPFLCNPRSHFARSHKMVCVTEEFNVWNNLNNTQLQNSITRYLPAESQTISFHVHLHCFPPSFLFFSTINHLFLTAGEGVYFAALAGRQIHTDKRASPGHSLLCNYFI